MEFKYGLNEVLAAIRDYGPVTFIPNTKQVEGLKKALDDDYQPAFREYLKSHPLKPITVNLIGWGRETKLIFTEAE